MNRIFYFLIFTFYFITLHAQVKPDTSGFTRPTEHQIPIQEYEQKLADLKGRYESAKQEKQIQQQQNRIRMQNYLFIGIGGLVLLGGLLIHSHYRRYKLRQESKMQTELMRQHELAVKAVIEAEENERQRIAKDLH